MCVKFVNILQMKKKNKLDKNVRQMKSIKNVI